MSLFSTDWIDDDLGLFMNALSGWNAPRETMWEAPRSLGFPTTQLPLTINEEGEGEGEGAGGNSRKSWFPHVDVGEADDHYEMWLDIPGLQCDDIHLDVKGNVLVVKGKKKYGPLNQTLLVRERNMGKFYRVIPLPTNIDPSKVAANYENGVLHILVPKPPTRSKGTKITIGTHAKNQQGQHIDQGSSLPANMSIPVHTDEEEVNLSAAGIGREAGMPETPEKQKLEKEKPKKKKKEKKEKNVEKGGKPEEKKLEEKKEEKKPEEKNIEAKKMEEKKLEGEIREQGFEAAAEPGICASGGGKM